jgi:hypothetical protein
VRPFIAAFPLWPALARMARKEGDMGKAAMNGRTPKPVVRRSSPRPGGVGLHFSTSLVSCVKTDPSRCRLPVSVPSLRFYLEAFQSARCAAGRTGSPSYVLRYHLPFAIGPVAHAPACACFCTMRATGRLFRNSAILRGAEQCLRGALKSWQDRCLRSSAVLPGAAEQGAFQGPLRLSKGA